MVSLTELLNKWEVQLLVILSFTLQLFLFFTGGLRQSSSNAFLRLFMWLAYLGADFVAVYALGYLSRLEDATHGTGRDTLLGDMNQLVFLWAPFLLIHLGGQDTITAFAIEDNRLWLRHLLNLVIQVILALYVFYKSIGWHNMQLLGAGVFVFIAGIIKYSERTLALMYGDLTSMSSSNKEETKENVPPLNRRCDYPSLVCFALHSTSVIRDIFVGRRITNITERQTHSLSIELFRRRSQSIQGKVDEGQVHKILEVELALVYNDLYTKAKVLRTKEGIILRCVSMVSIVVALVIFCWSSSQRYNRVDVAITYALFIGGIFLEGCAMVAMVIMSPWTWAWLEARGYHRLAGMSMYLLTSNVGWPERRPLWSSSMGQYSLRSYLGNYSDKARPSQLLMSMIRKMASKVGIRREKLLWLSKLLDTQNVHVGSNIIMDVLQGVDRVRPSHGEPRAPPKWPNLAPFLSEMLVQIAEMSLGDVILYLHRFTEAQLSKYPPASDSDMAANAGEASSATASRRLGALVDECRKLSNYMAYVFVAQPSMLLLNGVPEDVLQYFSTVGLFKEGDGDLGWEHHDPPASMETLEEMKEMWIRFLLYAAGKSRPEAHAAQLAKGGELLTLAWLLMAHWMVGEIGQRLELHDALQVQRRPIAYG